MAKKKIKEPAPEPPPTAENMIKELILDAIETWETKENVDVRMANTFARHIANYIMQGGVVLPAAGFSLTDTFGNDVILGEWDRINRLLVLNVAPPAKRFMFSFVAPGTIDMHTEE